MELKKLTLQAFGPFKDREIIQFEKDNINKGLLLITGDTGAGKTSIFDAICFALYGHASGETRNTKSLRSDFAPTDKETFVELEFYHNGKLYTVKRSPEYLRKNKRGDGVIKQAPKAEIEINGRIITKTNDVTKEIENLLGLDFKQFRQVAMLSQGEFTKFLLASSEDKTSIFRKIFDTDIYSKLMTKLNDDCKLSYIEYQKYVEQLTNEIRKLNEPEYLNVTYDKLLEMIDLKIKEEETEYQKLKKITVEENKKLIEKTSIFKNLDALNQKIEKYNDFNSKLTQLINDNKDIDDKKMIRDYNINVVPLIANIQEQMDKNKQNMKTYHKSLEEAKESLKKVQNQMEEKKEEFLRIENYDTLYDQYSKSLEDLKISIDNLTNFNDLKKHKEELENKLQIFIERDVEETNKYANMKQKYYSNLVFSIAKDLKESEPCPVCGSKEHPSVALKNIDSVTKEDLEKQEEIYNMTHSEVGKLETSIKSKHEEMEKLNIQDIHNTFEQLEQLKNKNEQVKMEFLQLKSDKIRLDKIKKELHTQNISLTKARENYELELQKCDKESKEFEIKLNEILKSNNTNLVECLNKMLDKEELNSLKNFIENYDLKKKEYESSIQLLKEEVENKKIENLEDKKRELDELQEKYDLLNQEEKEKYKDLAQLKNSNKVIKELILLYRKAQERYALIKNISDTANGSLTGRQKITFENYVQAYYLNSMLIEANKRLFKMTDGRYELKRSEEESNLRGKVGLDFSVFDAYTGKDRDVSTLSGGEKFKASLSLALGLSDVISMYAGGIRTDCLFVDEGFGSLDQESLNHALNTLSDLVDNDKLVGIISHVSELISRIDHQIHVVKVNNGSHIEITS